MQEVEIGIVKHYFDRIGAVAIEMSDGELKVGDTIHIKGHTTDVTEVVASLQVEHQAISVAHKGDAVGIKITGKAREHDKVFKVLEP